MWFGCWRQRLMRLSGQRNAATHRDWKTSMPSSLPILLTWYNRSVRLRSTLEEFHAINTIQHRCKNKLLFLGFRPQELLWFNKLLLLHNCISVIHHSPPFLYCKASLLNSGHCTHVLMTCTVGRYTRIWLVLMPVLCVVHNFRFWHFYCNRLQDCLRKTFHHFIPSVVCCKMCHRCLFCLQHLYRALMFFTAQGSIQNNFSAQKDSSIKQCTS